jgi:hypothetical protein
MVELMNQAQHFGGAFDSGGSGSGGEEFREGLDLTERECMYKLSMFQVLTSIAVFSLAQESARQTRNWYTGIERNR